MTANKMKRCRNCNFMVDSLLKFCPYCADDNVGFDPDKQDDDLDYIHIRGQRYPHDNTVVDGSVAGLIRLRDYINKALDGYENGEGGFSYYNNLFQNDGEQYGIEVRCWSNKDMEKISNSYSRNDYKVKIDVDELVDGKYSYGDIFQMAGKDFADRCRDAGFLSNNDEDKNGEVNE